MRKKIFLISVLIIVVFLVACSAGSEDVENRNEIELAENEDVKNQNKIELVENEDIENQNKIESIESELEKIEIHGDFFILEDVAEMADLATDIISGKVLDRRVEWINLRWPRELVVEDMLNHGMSQEEIDYELYGVGFEPVYDLMTIYRIQVLEVFQGILSVGEIVEVMRRGGEYENQYWFMADAIELIVDTELILFLFSRRLTGNPFVLVSHIQGVYYIPSSLEEYEYLVEYENLELELENASELDPVVLTIGDLVEIADEDRLLRYDDASE